MIAPAQGPLFIVQRNLFCPKERPETTALGVFTLENEPVPLITLHVPIAGAIGLFAARVVLLFGRHTVWSAPAFAAGEEGLKTVITTSSVNVPQGPLLMVQRNRFTPMLRPVTVVF